jgi:hypothetical protein
MAFGVIQRKVLQLLDARLERDSIETPVQLADALGGLHLGAEVPLAIIATTLRESEETITAWMLRRTAPPTHFDWVETAKRLRRLIADTLAEHHAKPH